MYMKDSGYMIKQADKVLTLIQMGQNSPENGTRTNRMVMELKHGQTVLGMKDTTAMERKKEKENSIGETEVDILVNSMTIIFMVSVNINGQMEESTKVSGRTTKCMEQVNLLGEMDVVILVNTCGIKKKDLEYFSGQTAEDMREIGSKVNSMGKEFSSQRMVLAKKVCGKMVNE